MTNNWYKGLLAGILLLLPGIAVAQQAANQVIIVKSSDNAYFTQSIETLISHVDKAVRFKVIMVKDLPDSIKDGDSGNLYVTLGQSAAEAVNRLDQPPRSISAYLTLEQFKRLNGKNQLAVLLDQTLNRYLAFCKLMLAVDSVGILDEYPVKLEKQQSEFLGKLQMELRQYRIDPFNKLLPVLRQLLGQSDVLLMLPRQSIYNRDSLKGVLLTSYRNRKPVISYSPAHVKSGALASIYSSPTDIGRHLALLLNKRLQNPGYKAPEYEYARFYSISTNRRVARALDIDLPMESKLRSALDRLEP
ncbi:MAG: hypothetical protein OEU50_14670 [Gammaproteobacteria bacterium]|nr:hypothetical protein [Gammaproteobacteria bacterium]